MKLTSLNLLALLAITMVLSSEAKNYCDICKDHTMCIYQNFGSKCKKHLAADVNKATQKEIVDLHNHLRSEVAMGKESRGKSGPQPSASNMRALEWDEELAHIAQRWANQCDFGHDKCRNVERFAVGQNVYMSWSSGGPVNSKEDWKGAVNAWYNEVAKFNKDYVPKFKFDEGTGHYTQVVWAKTSRVGCGFIAHSTKDGLIKYYVCNYGMAGNWLGEAIYEKGNACSLCPKGTSCKGQGLCH